jgi:hypothetical protein
MAAHWREQVKRRKRRKAVQLLSVGAMQQVVVVALKAYSS